MKKNGRRKTTGRIETITREGFQLAVKEAVRPEMEKIEERLNQLSDRNSVDREHMDAFKRPFKEQKMKDQEAYQRASKKVEAKMGFFIHLAVYVGVNTLLIVINLLTAKQIWFLWPLFGWGIGLLFHGLNVFVFSSKSSFKERMIEKEMEKEDLKRP